MLNGTEAARVVKRHLPRGKIQAYIDYKDLFVFQVFDDDPLEGDYDPFYSVHKQTGKFEEFSILTDGDTVELVSLFKTAKQ